MGDPDTMTRARGRAASDRGGKGLDRLLEDLAHARDRDEVAAAAVRAAADEAGSGGAALLASRGAAVFAVLDAVGWPRPPAEVELGELTSPLWQAALGNDPVGWTADQPPVLDELADAGWQRLLAIGVPVSGRRSALLVVGDDGVEPIADADQALWRVAAVTGLALDRATRAEEHATLERLLSAAVATAGQMAATGQPEVLAERFVTALVDDVGFAGAALWQPPPDGRGTLQLTTSRGLPTAVAAAVADLAPQSMAVRLHDGRLPSPLARAGAAAATSSWPGHRLRLVAIPAPAGGVLGVYHREPLDALIDGVLATLARTFAAAAHQATLHAQARTVVDSLQHELRPRALPPPDSGIDLGWTHRSATAGEEVGGDFFDVLHAETGHVGVACGDVAGKGVSAASLTVMAVHSLRAYALHGSPPGVVLGLLNTAVCAQTPDERFVTLAYLRLDPATGTGRLAVAGHPPPMHVRADGRVHPVEVATGMPAGIDPQASFPETPVTIEPGEALVLYTDGVTEARRARPHGAAGGPHPDPGGAHPDPGPSSDDGDEPALLGETGLTRILADSASAGQGDAQSIADAVWAGVQAWTGGETTDDCAVVVVRRRG